MSDYLSSTMTNSLLKASQNQTAQASQNAKAAMDLQNSKKFDQAAEDFEAVFIAEMMKPMFEGLSTDGMFGGGKGEEIFRDMMVQEYGKIMARTGKIGIADPVKQAMIQMQEQANATTP